MMSRPHLAMGIATSMLIMKPQSPKECFVCIIGGAIGGVVPDLDIIDNDHTGDAKLGEVIAIVISLVCLGLDSIFKTGVLNEFLSNGTTFPIACLVIFVGLYMFGLTQPHRGFTHSILGIVLYTIPFLLINWELGVAFFLGFLSHIILDLLNHRKVNLLYPTKLGICFHLCYADGEVSNALMYIGIIISVVMLINGLLLHLV